MSPSHPPSAPRQDLDPAALARLVHRLEASPSPPWLHGEVARRMGERLAVIRRTPDTVLQWWGHAGASDEVLAAAYPQARRLHVETDVDAARRRAQAARAPWWSSRRWMASAPTVVGEGDLAPRAAQLLWSNMRLHWVADPRDLFTRWKRVLADDGFLMFSTVGPDTLAELRDIYRALGWPPPAADFVDMHDLGDMLVEAGFADPVMDQEPLVLTWPDAPALLAELRALGANVRVDRAAGLRTPRWRQRLCEALEARRDAQGRARLRFEIVYGHAFNAPPRAKVAARTEVALDDFRAMARGPAGGGRSPI